MQKETKFFDSLASHIKKLYLYLELMEKCKSVDINEELFFINNQLNYIQKQCDLFNNVQSYIKKVEEDDRNNKICSYK